MSSVNDILEDSIIYAPCVFVPWGHILLPWDGGCTKTFKSQELLNTSLIPSLFFNIFVLH